MAEDLPYLGIHGYYNDNSSSSNPKRFVSVRDGQGKSAWVQVGAETPNGYKIVDYNEDKNHAVISRGGYEYHLPMQQAVILDSNKPNPYNPSWNNAQSQYNDTLSFNDFKGLVEFRKKQETFNSMIEDATGMPLYQIKESQARTKTMKEMAGLTGQLTDHEQKMLNPSSYTQDPMKMLTPDTSSMDFNSDGIDEATGTVRYTDGDEAKLQGLIDREDIPDNVKTNARNGLEFLNQLKEKNRPIE